MSLNVARAWASAAYTAGHKMGVENPDCPEVDIDEYRPKRGKKSVGVKKGAGSPKKSNSGAASLPFNPARCDARVWNGGFGAQCSKAHGEDVAFCPLHNKQLEKSLAAGGSDLRCGCWSKERPTRTLDGKDEVIKWKDASTDCSESPSTSVGDHPKPRGPAPKSECGGKKVWNGEIGQWEDPVLSGSETEDMSDEENVVVGGVVEKAVEIVAKKVVEEKVEKNIDGIEVGEETIDGKYYKVTETSEIIQNGNGTETEIISTHFNEVDSPPEEAEPEPEAEAEVEPEPEAVAEAVAEVEAEQEASSTQERKLENEVELDEVTYSPGSPRECIDTQIDGDKLIHQGVTYMFDEDDGLIYHSETYDDVGKYCTMTATLTWKSKKNEIAHLKVVSGLGSR